MREVRPLRSTGITPLPRYYEPVRLPAAAAAALWIPLRRCGPRGPHHAGSPRTLDSSVVARPSQSPRAARCVHPLITSAPVAGFSISGSMAAATGFTRPNRIRVRWAHDFARPDHPRSGARQPIYRTDPFRAVGYPPTPDRSYMLNEQFTWLTPLSQLDKSGLPWRIRRNGVTETNGEDARVATPAGGRRSPCQA